jgi:hypothetical protein
MSIKIGPSGYWRGHPIYWDGKQHRYQDGIDSNHPECGFCGLDTPESGHDPCVGELPSVMNACCGHGQTDEAYVQFSQNCRISGQSALLYIRRMKCGNVTNKAKTYMSGLR